MAIMATIKIRAGFLPIEIANYFRESTSSKGLHLIKHILHVEESLSLIHI